MRQHVAYRFLQASTNPPRCQKAVSHFFYIACKPSEIVVTFNKILAILATDNFEQVFCVFVSTLYTVVPNYSYTRRVLVRRQTTADDTQMAAWCPAVCLFAL